MTDGNGHEGPPIPPPGVPEAKPPQPPTLPEQGQETHPPFEPTFDRDSDTEDLIDLLRVVQNTQLSDEQSNALNQLIEQDTGSPTDIQFSLPRIEDDDESILETIPLFNLKKTKDPNTLSSQVRQIWKDLRKNQQSISFGNYLREIVQLVTNDDNAKSNQSPNYQPTSEPPINADIDTSELALILPKKIQDYDADPDDKALATQYICRLYDRLRIQRQQASAITQPHRPTNQ